jgi:hypothetical protein
MEGKGKGFLAMELFFLLKLISDFVVSYLSHRDLKFGRH